MRSLLRLRRIERVLRERPPYDPRQSLEPAERELADRVLERLASEPPLAVNPLAAAWFEAVIRPRLRSWLRYEERHRTWAAGAKKAFVDARQRRTWRRLGHFPVDSPVFSGNVRAFIVRLLGEEEAPEGA